MRRLLIADSIRQVHRDSRGTYGYRRVQATLRSERDLVVNHKLVAQVMAELCLSGLSTRKFRKRNLVSVRTTSDLVKRNFSVTGPNQLWVTDVTEHPTTGILAVVGTPDERCCNGSDSSERRPRLRLCGLGPVFSKTGRVGD